jgi:hypothetical protein
MPGGVQSTAARLCYTKLTLAWLAMMKTIILTTITAIFLTGTVAAEEHLQPPDVVACLEAVETLDLHYRSTLKPQCLQIAYQTCLPNDNNPKGCIDIQLASLRDFSENLLAKLPSEIDGTAIQRRRYQNSLEKERLTVSVTPNCDEPDSVEQVACEMVDVGIATISIMVLAPQAGLD